MKILFFTYDFPYPANSGGKVRAYNLLKQKDSDVEVVLFSFAREGFNNEYLEHMKSLGIDKIHFFPRRKLKDPRNLPSFIHKNHSLFYYLYFSEEIKNSLLKIINEEKIDVVHFESFYTGYYICKELASLKVKQIFGTENIEATLYEDYIFYNVNRFLKPFFTHQLKKIKREEQQMFLNADLSLAVTFDEAGFIKNISKKEVFVIENGVDLQQFPFQKKNYENEKNLLFVGNFSYFPNKDAIQFLTDHVISKLDHPGIRFTIIGKGAERLPIKQKNVRLIEYAADIVAEYKNADIFLSPIRIGGGTNFKVLEAMATGLPVIAFPERASALGVEHMKEIILAKKEEFYSSLLQLIRDRNLQEKIAKNARKFVEKKYSWEVIGKKMNKIWKM